MKHQFKASIIAFFVTGFIYAAITATFDYLEEESFDLTGFIFNFISIGCFMAVFQYLQANWKEKRAN